MPFASRLLLVAATALCLVSPVRAQEAPRSAKRAFALSLLVPGLGHRYVHGGDWDGAATAFVLADAGLWLGLVGSDLRRGQIVSDYETYAATHAGALVEGKDRQFFLNLASYRSSDEFLEVVLRNRAWEQVNYVAERTNQWAWETEEDFLAFREMRSDAESLRRRGTFFIGALVANRLLSGFTALRAANRVNDAAVDVALSLGPPAPAGDAPTLNLRLLF